MYLSKTRGFTLVELLVAAALAVVIMTISYTAFYELSSMQNELTAYSRATIEGRRVTDTLRNDFAGIQPQFGIYLRGDTLAFVTASASVDIDSDISTDHHDHRFRTGADVPTELAIVVYYLDVIRARNGGYVEEVNYGFPAVVKSIAADHVTQIEQSVGNAANYELDWGKASFETKAKGDIIPVQFCLRRLVIWLDASLKPVEPQYMIDSNGNTILNPSRIQDGMDRNVSAQEPIPNALLTSLRDLYIKPISFISGGRQYQDGWTDNWAWVDNIRANHQISSKLQILSRELVPTVEQAGERYIGGGTLQENVKAKDVIRAAESIYYTRPIFRVEKDDSTEWADVDKKLPYQIWIEFSVQDLKIESKTSPVFETVFPVGG